MSSRSSNNFFQPVISVFGLAISLITAILPLFNDEILTKLFINEELARPISFMAFMIGIAIIWQITEFQPDLEFSFLKKKKGGPYSEYWININNKNIIWVILLFNVIFGILFFYFGGENFNNKTMAIFQACFYLLFFLSLIATFAILFSQTKQKFNKTEDRENFPTTIFETLERHRIIKPYIEIYENRDMDFKEKQNEDLPYTVGECKKIKIKTAIQNEEIIEFIASNDGKEIIKILKKGN